MKRTLFLALILFFLFLTEILRVYFIMPFPGSQHSNTLAIAYFLHQYTWWFRIAGWLLFLLVFLRGAGGVKLWKRIFLIFFLLLYAVVFYFFNFKFLADKMFYQPKQKLMAEAAQNKVDSNKLIIGVFLNGEARAYPVEIIGYHHQVQDTIGGQPVMITYCTVCRTGRVFSPVVNGKQQHFRLVGMDHFNAMFEDEETKSWWRQATGEAVTGPLKGLSLTEIHSQQMRLGAWLQLHPQSLILQPDPGFKKQYDDLKGYDEGTLKSGLEKRDTASWQFKSWVIGVLAEGKAKAFDWNELVQKRVVNDSIAGREIVLYLQQDGKSFHVFYYPLLKQPAYFEADSSTGLLKERNSGTLWSPAGICISGAYQGMQLAPVAAYQEFWHSWQQFHPGTTRR